MSVKLCKLQWVRYVERIDGVRIAKRTMRSKRKTTEKMGGHDICVTTEARDQRPEIFRVNVFWRSRLDVGTSSRYYTASVGKIEGQYVKKLFRSHYMSNSPWE